MSKKLPSSHKGKIGSLPVAIRDEVNERLRDGDTGPAICDWLNSQEEVLKVLEERWNEQPINPQNLSEWRKGGYAIYLRNIDRHEHLRRLDERANRLVTEVSATKISGAAQRIAAGQMLEMLEAVEEGDTLALMEILDDLTKSVDRSEKNAIAREKLELDKRKTDQKDTELALSRDKFETNTVTQFLKWQNSKEAIAILESGKPETVQTEELRQLFFGSMMSDDE